MFSRALGVLLALFLFACPLIAQENPDPANVSGPKAEGIELPPDTTVSNDEGFVNIQAKCKGTVRWLVVAGVRVKYITNDSNNSIIVSIPANGGVITVFAVGLVDGKITEFVRTNITVRGGVSPPNDPVNPPPPNGPLHITFVLDLNNTTPELAAILNSQTLRKAIADRGNLMRIYDSKSPVIAQKKLEHLVTGGPTMIIQKNDGSLAKSPSFNGSVTIPKTEQEVLSILRSLGVN